MISSTPSFLLLAHHQKHSFPHFLSLFLLSSSSLVLCFLSIRCMCSSSSLFVWAVSRSPCSKATRSVLLRQSDSSDDSYIHTHITLFLSPPLFLSNHINFVSWVDGFVCEVPDSVSSDGEVAEPGSFNLHDLFFSSRYVAFE